MSADPGEIRLGDHDYPVEFVTAHWIQADPEGYILALNVAQRLGYVRASDEWVNLTEPLPDRLQDVAHQLVQSGRLPEFEGCFR